MKSNKLLNQARIRSQLTLDQLAEKSGYSKSYLSLIENGNRPLRKSVLKNLNPILSLSSDDYLEIFKAIEIEQPSLLIDMKPLSNRKKELAILFSRRLLDLSEYDIESVLAIISKD